MKDVALITLHGMGKVKPSYYSKLEAGLQSRLGDAWTRVSFQNVQYAPILQKPEDELWAAMIDESANRLDGKELREFLLYGFGDAGSLEHSAAQADKTQYISVQREIQGALERALDDFKGDTSKPVVIIAQSLGCQVISNYLWDAGAGKNIFAELPKINPAKNEFLKLGSLTNLVTTGCNIPLFIGGIADRKCFNKPKQFLAWDNYYDPDDVLGWPLRQLGPMYKDIVTDHQINSGGLFSSWNVSSHGRYWSDANVIDPLSDILVSRMG